MRPPKGRGEEMNMAQRTLNTEHGLDVASVKARLEKLLPDIEAAAEIAEAQRKPVDAVIAGLAQTGIFRAFVPKRYGGMEIGLNDFIDLGIAVGERCTSTGWVTTFYMEHNWILAQFGRTAQDAIFGKQPFVLAPASISPNGRAQREEQGYSLTGRWAWGTGVMHADWVMLNGVIAGEKPEPRLFIVPREQITIEDVWQTSGMRGTGSNDMLADRVQVDEAFSEPLRGMSVGRGSGVEDTDTSYRYPMMPLLAIAASIPALAGARRALTLFEKRLESRTLYGSGAKQIEQAPAHIRLGRIAGQIAALESQLRAIAQELEAWGKRDEICPPLIRSRLRLGVAEIVRACRDAVMTLVEASGAGAHMANSPLQRIQRDLNMLSCHTVFDVDAAAENHGRLLLGLEPATPV